MDIRPTSTTGTHRGKRIIHRSIVGGIVAVILGLTVLASTSSGTTAQSAKKVTLADGSQVSVATALPEDGTDLQKEQWYQSVLADPNVLGTAAPKTAAQVYDSRTYSLASDQSADSSDGSGVAVESSAAPEATATATYISDEQQQAIQDAGQALEPVGEKVAAAYETYSKAHGASMWTGGVANAATKGADGVTDAFAQALQEGADSSWNEIDSHDVASTGTYYEPRTPAVWVATDLSQGRVTVTVQRTVTVDGEQRTDYPQVAVYFTSTDSGKTWKVSNVSVR